MVYVNTSVRSTVIAVSIFAVDSLSTLPTTYQHEGAWMPRHGVFSRPFGRFFLLGITTMIVAAGTVSAQDSEYSDPFALDDYKDWHEATMPTPYGVIAYGTLPLYGQPEEGTELSNPFRAGVMAYYDAWQAAFEVRPEATYFRLMPRSVGRDGFIAAVLEVGFASTSFETDDYYEGPQTVEVSETRYGMGISYHSGNSESIGPRYLLDATFGFYDRTFQQADHPFYFTLQAGVLLRVPLGPVAVNAGPYLEYGQGMLTYTASPRFIEPSATYFRAGLHIEVAMNFNRPQYLTGAQ